MIDYKLDEKPEGVTIIEGFPSFGMVSTLAIEYLLEHLDAEMVGEFVYDDLSPTLAIHDGEIQHPMSIWHDDEHDLLILHTAQNIEDLEWKFAEKIKELAEEVKAEEIISLEGMAGAKDEEESTAYTFKNEDLKEAGAEDLNETILMGITAALMLRSDKTTPLFAEAHSSLPDGHAAVEIIKVLNEYLDMGVDTKPLMKKAQEFEDKLKNMFEKKQQAQEEAKKRRLNYFG